MLPGNLTRPRGVKGSSLLSETQARLQSHNGMSGLDRLAVYNRQYWFRLITCMQEDYVCTVHVMGLDVFNQWVIRFLDANPGDSPYLTDLDRKFPAYLEKKYGGRNRSAVLEAAAYDKAFARAFESATQHPQLNEAPPPGEEGEGARQPAAMNPARLRLALAPHASVVALTRDFAAYRLLCLADPELTARFALRAKRSTVCIYRRDNVIYEKELSAAEYLVLSLLQRFEASGKQPRTLSQLMRALEKEASPRALKAVERGLAGWFSDWTELGIISVG